MKKIFILRHAAYNDAYKGTQEITEEGIEQSRSLAERIRNNIGEIKDITIICSTALRAVQTAAILCPLLSVKELSTDQKLRNDDTENFNWLKQFIEEFDGECLIIITHLEFVVDFPTKTLNFHREHSPNCYGFLITDGVYSHF